MESGRELWLDDMEVSNGSRNESGPRRLQVFGQRRIASVKDHNKRQRDVAEVAEIVAAVL